MGLKRVTFIVFSLLLSSAALAEAPLLIATGDYPPYTSSTMTSGGFMGAIVKRSMALAGLQENTSYLPWGRGYLGVQKMHFDATFPYIKTPERELTFLYSDAIFPVVATIFVRKKDAERYSRPEDFLGGSFCLPKGFAIDNAAPLLKMGLKELVRAADDEACLEMVKRGRVTAYPVDVLIGEHIRQQQPQRFASLTSLNWAVNKSDFYLLVSKHHPHGPELIAHFNKGLRKLKASPEWTQILGQHGIDERRLNSLRETPLSAPTE